MNQTEKLVAMQLLKKYMIPVIAEQRQCDLEKAEVSFNKDCEDVEGKEMLNAFLSAMEEYAQQSQPNQSKLLEALEKIADIDCDSPARYCVNIAQQALESYKDGWVSVNVKFDVGSVILENERGDRYKSESESLIDFFMLSEQHLPSQPQTKTI